MYFQGLAKTISVIFMYVIVRVFTVIEYSRLSLLSINRNNNIIDILYQCLFRPSGDFFFSLDVLCILISPTQYLY